MSKMAELHHETEILAPHRLTPVEWAALRHDAACEAWKSAYTPLDYNTVWRMTDAVLRVAIPNRLPEGER